MKLATMSASVGIDSMARIALASSAGRLRQQLHGLDGRSRKVSPRASTSRSITAGSLCSSMRATRNGSRLT
jgi:hypothetical protein